MKKKNKTLIYPLIMLSILLMLISGCEKEDDNNTALPVLRTDSIIDFTQTTACCSAYVISVGGSTITVRGVCWSTDTNPTIADTKTSQPDYGLGTGHFLNNITGLTANK